MNELFEASLSKDNEPLASRMRPQSLDEFVGQDHIVGPGRLLRRAIQADQLSSLIFYGPPGTGKTTLARIIAANTKSHFVSLNAVLSGVADIRREIDAARSARSLHGRKTILFVDEVHRWNKSQQDALLPWVENGMVILIGATTENPYFEVNKALVSRSRIFQLKSLNDDHLLQVARQTLNDPQRGYGKWKVQFESGALEHLVKVSAGDARSLLNALQLAVETSPDIYPPPEGALIDISMEAAEQSIQQKAVLYDKEGDYHFDTISAFIKSIRGSDPDAALYWMALMIRAGEEPRFIFRRMLISACEDIGLADPRAISVVEACAAAYDRVGLPEGQYHLTHACLYLACAPKSNSALGYFDALNVIDKEQSRVVPNHLRDSSRDSHAFGHGEGYKYPHSWREHWTAQQYLPEGLTGRVFYRPGELGYEGRIRQDVLMRREAQLAEMINFEGSESSEVLTYSPNDNERERWVRRSESAQAALSLKIREILFSHWTAQRHQRVFIPADPGGTLIWEANRRVPEGAVLALCANMEAYSALKWLASGLQAVERPILLNGEIDSTAVQNHLKESEFRAEVILGRNWLTRYPNPKRRKEVLEAVESIIAPEGILLLAESLPGQGSCLSDFIPPGSLGDEDASFREAEKAFIKSLASQISSVSSAQLPPQWTNIETWNADVQESRLIGAALLDRWLIPERPGGYGFALSESLGADRWKKISESLKSMLKGRLLMWSSHFMIIKARYN